MGIDGLHVRILCTLMALPYESAFSGDTGVRGLLDVRDVPVRIHVAYLDTLPWNRGEAGVSQGRVR